MPAHRLHSCSPSREPALLAELARTFPASSHRALAAGWVVSAIADSETAVVRAVAFARQCLTDPELVTCPSISTWADEGARRIISGLREHDGPWRLHVFCQDIQGAPLKPRRCQLILEGLDELLRKKQRRLLRTRVDDPARPWSDDELLVQLALVEPDLGYFSITRPAERRIVRRVISRFPGGQPAISEDERPPSRAYLKLLEAQAHLGAWIEAGETCVDLGGSPGGWSWVALERGASVIAIDRSPLRDDLMRDPRLRFVRGDGFAYEPDEPVDWLLCDIIAFPQRSIELLRAWTGRRRCRRFCVTIKFRGEEDYALLERCKEVLDASGAEYMLRQLAHNKNEVTAMGALAAGER